MADKKVLLIESGHFIGGVIRSLFNPYEQLRVTEASPANHHELLQAVIRTKPEIIVLDDTISDNYLSYLLQYMQKARGVRVIVVNTGSNHVEVYEKHQIPVNQTADFIAIL